MACSRCSRRRLDPRPRRPRLGAEGPRHLLPSDPNQATVLSSRPPGMGGAEPRLARSPPARALSSPQNFTTSTSRLDTTNTTATPHPNTRTGWPRRSSPAGTQPGQAQRTTFWECRQGTRGGETRVWTRRAPKESTGGRCFLFGGVAAGTHTPETRPPFPPLDLHFSRPCPGSAERFTHTHATGGPCTAPSALHAHTHTHIHTVKIADRHSSGAGGAQARKKRVGSGDEVPAPSPSLGPPATPHAHACPAHRPHKKMTLPPSLHAGARKAARAGGQTPPASRFPHPSLVVMLLSLLSVSLWRQKAHSPHFFPSFSTPPRATGRSP